MPHLIETRHHRHPAGFSVAELLICTTLIGILLGLGVPGFRHFLREAEMARAVNALVADVHRARQTAQVQARTVTLCASTTGGACEQSLDWSQGWLLAASRSAEAGEARALSRVTPDPADGIRIVANRRMFEFRPFTLRDTNGSLWFCDRQKIARQRRVLISPTGRPRVVFADESQPGSSCGA
jgi:type IV fimbrial biogenesis protein FimT